MNPTLSARLRSWRQDRYWRSHPAAPWPVPMEPATALLHQVLPVPAVAIPELAEAPSALQSLGQIVAAVPAEVACSETVCLETVSIATVCSETVPAPRPTEVIQPEAVAGKAGPDKAVVLAAVLLQVEGAEPVGGPAVGAISLGVNAVASRAAVGQADAEPWTPWVPAAACQRLGAPAAGRGGASVVAAAHQSPPDSSPPDSRQRQVAGLLIGALVALVEGWLALRGLLRQLAAIWGSSAAVSKPCLRQRQWGAVRRGTCVPLFAQEVVQEAP